MAEQTWTERTGRETIDWFKRYESSQFLQSIATNGGFGLKEVFGDSYSQLVNKPNLMKEAALALEAAFLKDGVKIEASEDKITISPDSAKPGYKPKLNAN